MSPKKFVSMTKEMVRDIEVVLSVYETSYRKCERIEQIINHFKEAIKDEVEKG